MTFSALSSSRLVTISFCIVSTRDGSCFTLSGRGEFFFGPAAMVFLRGEPGEAGASARTGFTARFLGFGWWRAGEAGV
jgi:hypothetical protein